MSVRDSDRTLNVDENRSIVASSSAAAVSSSAPRQLFIALSEVGVVVWSAIGEIVDVALSNSLITHQKVL